MKTIRYYSDIGLVPETRRSPAGYRRALYARLPGRIQFSTWWPRVFGVALLVFGLLFVVLAVAVVR